MLAASIWQAICPLRFMAPRRTHGPILALNFVCVCVCVCLSLSRALSRSHAHAHATLHTDRLHPAPPIGTATCQKPMYLEASITYALQPLCCNSVLIQTHLALELRYLKHIHSTLLCSMRPCNSRHAPATLKWRPKRPKWKEMKAQKAKIKGNEGKSSWVSILAVWWSQGTLNMSTVHRTQGAERYPNKSLWLTDSEFWDVLSIFP